MIRKVVKAIITMVNVLALTTAMMVYFLAKQAEAPEIIAPDEWVLVSATDDPPLGYWTTPIVTVSVAGDLAGQGWRVKSAVRKWNVATAGQITMVVVSDGGLVKVNGVDRLPGKWGEAIVWGYPDKSIDHVDISLLRSVPVGERHRVVLHELGHALGLGHTSSQRAIMGYNYDWTVIGGRVGSPGTELEFAL